jgi:hypothetical protein
LLISRTSVALVLAWALRIYRFLPSDPLTLLDPSFGQTIFGPGTRDRTPQSR